MNNDRSDGQGNGENRSERRCLGAFAASVALSRGTEHVTARYTISFIFVTIHFPSASIQSAS